MPIHRAAVLGAIALALAVPATARAADLEPLKPCYISVGPAAAERESFALSGSGFAPNAVLEVRVDDELVTTVQADGTGALVALALSAPFQERGQRRFTVSVVEQGNPASTVTATSRVSAVGVRLRPGTARPSRRVRWSGRGFTLGGKVFAHYVYGGKIRRTVSLGRPSGPCGVFDLRRKQFPFAPRTGSWLLQIDQDPRYRVRPRTAYVQLAVDVSRIG